MVGEMAEHILWEQEIRRVAEVNDCWIIETKGGKVYEIPADDLVGYPEAGGMLCKNYSDAFEAY